MRRALRRHATTLILVALALAAAITLLVIDRGSVTTTEAEHRKRNLFEAWRPQEIEELTVTTRTAPGAPPRVARLVRGAPDDAGQRPWRVEIDGEGHPADEQAVDQFLGTLEFATAERRVSEDTAADTAADRAALGLDAPRLEVEIVMGKRRERLALGGAAPSPPGAAYAEVAGRGVFVITKQLAAALDVAPERFRTRVFVPYLSTELAGLHLDGEGGARHFVRAPWSGSRGGGFRFDGPAPGAPAGVRVHAPALDGVLAALGRMQAEAFLTEDQARRSASTKVTITQIPRDPSAKRGVIDVGGACPDKPEHVVAIRRDPSRAAVCVPASALEALSLDAARFVDLRLVEAPRDEITEVKLAAEGKTLEMARAEGQWHLRAPQDRELPANIGDALVQAILDVEATRFVEGDPQALGLAPPRATLRVLSTPPAAAAGAPQERVETLEIGAERGGAVHVRRLEDGALLVVPAEAAGALLPSDLSLRSPRVLDFEGDRVRSLRIQEGARVQRLRRTASNAWDLLEPTGEGLDADLGLASDVADLLGRLEAQRWAAPAADGGFGLSPPRLVIEAEVAPEEAEPQGEDAGAAAPKTVRVEIGAATSGGSFARTSEDPAVFVAPRALELAAGRLLLDRGALVVELDGIARVTLSPEKDKGKNLVLESTATGWRLAGTARDDADGAAARAAAIRDALADLRAEGAVSLGKPERHQGLEAPRLRITLEPKPRAGAAEAPIEIAFGVGDAWRGTSVVYARRKGVAATYVVAQAKARPLLEAAGAE